MSTSLTIEIETATGENIDVEALTAALATIDIKVQGVAKGPQLLALSSLKEAYETLGRALRLAGVLPYPPEEER